MPRRPPSRPFRRLLASAAVAAALAGCADAPLDWDLRRPGTGLSTAEAARQATAPRPAPDARGVISYPGYQVAVARRGDTPASIAERLGVPSAALARTNAIAEDAPLRAGELLVLPVRVAEPSAPTAAAGRVLPDDRVDVTTLAASAIERAEQRTAGTGTAAPSSAAPRPAASAPAAAPARPAGPEPVRHRVVRGETVYIIARRYNVTARSIAEWNGLGPDMALREGQTLLIPPAAAGAPPFARAAEDPPAPGRGSPTPEPPSASQPLPAETPPAAAAATPLPPSPDLGSGRTAASAARFAMPADGPVIRPYQKGRNDGIGIAAAAGSAVRAAADGTVARVTRDTRQVQIVLLRHTDNLITVYANLADIVVEEGETVRRGQTIARIARGEPAFLHFEVRRGFDSVDPMPFLQ